MILNRLRAEEEGGCSLPGGLAAREDLRDTELLARERLRGGRPSPACRLAGGKELAACHLSPRLGTQSFKNLERYAELATRARPLAMPSKAAAIRKPCDSKLEHIGGLLVQLHCCVEMVLELAFRGHKTATPGCASERPGLPFLGRLKVEPSHQPLSIRPSTDPEVCVDQLGVRREVNVLDAVCFKPRVAVL